MPFFFFSCHTDVHIFIKHTHKRMHAHTNTHKILVQHLGTSWKTPHSQFARTLTEVIQAAWYIN